MNASHFRNELAAEVREELGLPVIRCPKCGEHAAHYEADSLDANGLIVPGHFTCDPAATSVATEMRLL